MTLPALLVWLLPTLGAAALQPGEASPPAAPAAQITPETLIPAAALRADTALLRRTYETLHPGLYRYNTPEQLGARFAELDAFFAADRTLREAYLAFAGLTASIRCGHSYPNFFNQTKAIKAALFDGAVCVPFHFRWLDRRMIVTRSLCDDPAVVPGVEVISINGLPAGSILDRLLPLARADGSNDQKRIASLEVRGFDTIDAFDVYFSLSVPNPSQAFVLQLRAREGTTTTTTVRAVTRQERAARAAAADARPAADQPPWTLSVVSKDLAILEMPTWALYNSTWNWRAFLESSFRTLVRDQVANLVIDLRSNEGGLDCGDPIIAHLLSEPYIQRSARRLTRYRSVPPDLLPHLDTWDDGFRNWGEDAQPADDGFFTLKRDDGARDQKVIAPMEPRYAGRVFVLTSATNSSATFQFASIIQERGLGTLVGTGTGGNRRGINGGAFFFLRLPGSGIEIDVPLIGYFPTEPAPDAGLIPDENVVTTVEDIAAGRDPELERVRELIGMK